MADQQVTPAKFGSSSTAQQVARNLSLEKRNVLITGGNSGIGAECVRVFALMGANVYVLCRDTAKGQKLFSTTKNVEIIPLDLGDLKSVKDFLTLWAEKDLPVDILVNNAGVMAVPDYKTTKDGFEYQFGINHLGHFKLTLGLLPYIKRAGTAERPARIVHLSSLAHGQTEFEIKRVGTKGLYSDWFGNWKAYSMSKSANILFSNELQRRFTEEKVHVTSNAVHPGVIATDLSRDLTWYENLGFSMVTNKDIPQGAATTVYVATAPEIHGQGGLYFSDCHPTQTKKWINQQNATDLWNLSEKVLADKE